MGGIEVIQTYGVLRIVTDLEALRDVSEGRWHDAEARHGRALDRSRFRAMDGNLGVQNAPAAWQVDAHVLRLHAFAVDQEWAVS